MASTLLSVNVLRSLFCVLGCLMTATLIYTIVTDGLPFRKELLIPWMTTTLIDFYIIVVAIAAWIAYKELNLISAVVWIILLVCLGSITTCAYVVVQLFKLSSQEASQDPMYYVLVRYNSKDDIERKRKFSSVVAARIGFTALGCLMLGALIYTLLTDGSPFRTELLIPWMKALLVDFYIHIMAMSVWVIYKESSSLSAFIWIILFICLGSFTVCTYIVIQLFQLSSQDPFYLVLLNSRSRQKKRGLNDFINNSMYCTV
ncbi:uncharacterized protein LOC113357245 isoform X4 [Papaver somniferum]|uniref:uncharacterized protein LOC113357245 isoform X4 n=1 Tax=Papaver somniferum TaxID=3469 RepID=UPI000E6F7DD1|nr:uncharacterized protein LOC113357245 isoform X4 [Papaver somniferum]